MRHESEHSFLQASPPQLSVQPLLHVLVQLLEQLPSHPIEHSLLQLPEEKITGDA